MRRIALIEGNRELGGQIAQELQVQGYRVDCITRGREAELALEKGSYDFVIIDHELPDVSGFTLCRELRSRESMKRCPILLLTRGSADDRITGFDLGADDCLGHPISVRELSARVGAILRRYHPGDGRLDRYEGNGLIVDFRTFTAELKGEEVPLSSNEVEVLMVLIRHAPALVSKDQILMEAWPDESTRRATTRTVDHIIRSLRRKVGRDQITLLVGRGFRFELETDENLMSFPKRAENGSSLPFEAEKPRGH